MVWVNRAMEKTTQLYNVTDRWTLRFITGVTDYSFVDRPPISGATNVSPIVVTSTLHGLTNDSYSVRSRVSNVTNNGSGLVRITTPTAHTLVTGETVVIAGVGGVSAANGTFVITMVSSTTFDTTATFAGAYTSGGTVSHSIDRAYISGVIGNDAANGQYGIKNKTTNTFSLMTIPVDITDATNASPIVIKAPAHGRTSGDTVEVSGVSGNEAANGTWVITVVDADNFSLTGSIGSGAYTSGGIVMKAVSGNGTYVSGGHFWRMNEIPTYFNDFTEAFHVVTSWRQIIAPVTIEKMLERQAFDAPVSNAYLNYQSPFWMTRTRGEGKDYLKVYPAPTIDHDATLFGSVLVRARLFDAELLDSQIMLQSQYEQAIKCFVKAKIYWWLKLSEMAAVYEKEFAREINQLHARKHPHTQMTVSYR